MSTDEITLAEYMDHANGWEQYRTVRTRQSAEWTIERLPDTDHEVFRIVDRGPYFTIARRYVYASRE